MLINCIFRQPNLFVEQREEFPTVYFVHSKRRRDEKTSWVLEKKGQSSVKIIEFIPNYTLPFIKRNHFVEFVQRENDSSPEGGRRNSM